MPKSLTKMSPFCKSIHPKRKVRRPFVSVFFFSLSVMLRRGKKREKDCRKKSSQAPKAAAVLPCLLLAVGSSSPACPWNPTDDPPGRHLTQVSIVQVTKETHMHNVFFVCALKTKGRSKRKKKGGGGTED